MGGILWSKPTPEIPLDGLGFSANIERDFDPNTALNKLEQLLRASANTYRPSYLPPALVAAFYLGAYPEQLTALYEKWVAEICTPWPYEDPVAESVGKFNLQEFFGNQEYERKYYEYFLDCFTEESNWSNLVRAHSDLWPRLINNQFRPLIQLAAAVESDNEMTVSLALAMACADPQGSVPPISNEDVPAPKTVEGPYMAKKLQSMAQKALKTQSFEAVIPVHACAEVFLRPGGNVLSFEPSITILECLDKYISQPDLKFERLESVDPSDALFSEDWKLITYTRSRLVLEKLAL